MVFKDLIRRGQRMPEILAGLSHCLLLQERTLGEALKLAQKADEASPEGAAAAQSKLTLAEGLLLKGKKGKARKAFEAVAMPEGDLWLEARRSWLAALFAEDDEDLESAAELYNEVADLDDRGGLGDLARKRAAELEEELLLRSA